MLWIKKLLFTTILGTSVIAPSVTLTRQQEALERLELEATLKKWERLLEKISGDSDMEKLSKIFAKNLTTFSKFALINAVKQLLMRWAIQIWEHQEDFFPISQRLNKFFFYHHIYHWKTKNEVEELSWELIKKFFIDFFFNEKGWFLLSSFGDFSSFALKEWEEKERPMKLYEWKISYSNAGEESSSPESKKSKLYDPAVLENLKTRVPYLFPEIEGNKEYSTLISRLTHKNEIELNLFKKKWVTISDLSKITDGYALGALLHMYAQQSSTGPQVTSSPVQRTNQVTTLGLKKSDQTTNTPDPSKNPLYIFAGESGSSGTGQGSEGGKCLSIDGSIFKEEIKKEFNGKDPCMYGVRWINQGDNGGGGGGGGGGSSATKPKILVSREMDGISFYYLSDDSKLKGEANAKKLNQQEPEVIEKVKQYLTENFETIFAKFLVSKKNGTGGGENYTPFTIQSINTTNSGKSQTFDFTEFFKKNSSVIDASVAYLEDLYWTEKIKVLQNILLSVYKHTPQDIQVKRQYTGSSNTISLKKESGLFAPLPFKRSNGETTKKLELLPSESGSTTNSQKNEFFDDLLKLLPSKAQVATDSQNQKISLKSKAETLKKLIERKNGQKPFSEDSLRKLFLENPYFRAQLETISGNKLKAIDTIFALKAEGILFPNKGTGEGANKDFSKLLEEFSKTIKGTGGEGQTQGNNTWEDLINKGLFLEPFLTSPIEKKLLYGTFSSSTPVAPEGSSGTNTTEITTKSKSDWILDNFYFSDSGYESSATNYKELLAFLLSIKWLTENNHSNFEKLINHIFSKHNNKNAYLVWTQEITSENKKKLEGSEGQQEQQEQEVQAQPETKLKEFFKETITQELTNPLLRGENTMTGSSGSGDSGASITKNFSSKNSLYATDAYKNGQTGFVGTTGEKTKLGGFLGLVTESFSTREVPTALKNYIFGDFLKFNSTENTNYSVESASLQVPKAEGGAKGIVEGAFFADNHKRNLTKNEDLLSLLKEAKKKTSLLRYLDKETSNSLLIALSKSEKSEEVSELTLEELKEELSKALKSSDTAQVADIPTNQQSTNIKDLYKLFNRFSGYIYSSKGDQKSPYVFTEKKEGDKEEKYYVGFVYQVNRFDFDSEGIKKLKESLSENTLNTLIVLLASNREIRDWIYENEIIRQLSL